MAHILHYKHLRCRGTARAYFYCFGSTIVENVAIDILLTEPLSHRTVLGNLVLNKDSEYHHEHMIAQILELVWQWGMLIKRETRLPMK